MAKIVSDGPLISVIIPVYKTEKYLVRCVNSIQNQTYRNLEIILVDDGSPDQSGEICDELQKQDNRVRVIHQKNQGLSAARNTGLDICAGEYITFVDSDDWLECDILNKAICCGSQCVIWDRKAVNHAYSCSLLCDTESAFDKPYFKSGLEALNDWYFSVSDKWDLCYATGKLFHRSIFSDLRFKKGIYFEDIHLMPYWALKAKNICHLELEGYYYYQHSDSIMHNDNPSHQAKLYYDSFIIWQDHLELYHKKELSHLENELKKLMVDKVLTHSRNHSVPFQYAEFSKKIVRINIHDVVSMQQTLKGKIKYLLVEFLGIKVYTLLWGIKRNG